MKDTKQRTIVTISVPSEKKHILERFDKLVRVERNKGGRSALTIRAWREYIDHHWPGNPQKTLPQPSRADPHKDRAAINFLRHHAKLPLRQIAKIVGRSLGYVHEACGKTAFRGRRVNRKTIRIYKERFHAFMEGRYSTTREAFRLA